MESKLIEYKYKSHSNLEMIEYVFILGSNPMQKKTILFNIPNRYLEHAEKWIVKSDFISLLNGVTILDFDKYKEEVINVYNG